MYYIYYSLLEVVNVVIPINLQTGQSPHQFVIIVSHVEKRPEICQTLYMLLGPIYKIFMVLKLYGACIGSIICEFLYRGKLFPYNDLNRQNSGYKLSHIM